MPKNKDQKRFEVAEGPLLYVGKLAKDTRDSFMSTLADLEIARFTTVTRAADEADSYTLRLNVQPVAAGLVAASFADGMLRSFGSLFEARHGIAFQKKVAQLKKALEGKKVRIADSKAVIGNRTNITGICAAIEIGPESDSIDVRLKNSSRYGLMPEKLTVNGCSGRPYLGGTFTRSVTAA